MTSIVPMDRIRADQQAQPRTAINTEVVEQYSTEMGEGAKFPPLTVFHDGAVYWIADGFHRYYAGVGLGLAEMECDVHTGTLRDAILFSCSANATHGQRRTNEDKRRAIRRLLSDVEWCQWSDREIARRCAVTDKTVGALRPEVSAEIPQSGTRTFTRHGTISEMAVANINANRPAAKSQKPHKPAIVVEPQEDAGGWIAIALDDIARAGTSLPDPYEAAQRIPRQLMHHVRPEHLARLAGWLDDFCIEWKNRTEKAA